MLFNSYIFIFVFLPVALMGFAWLGRIGRPRLVFGWLVVASLIFYGWWNPAYLWIIVTSMVLNYLCARFVSQSANLPLRRVVLILGIFVNIGIIGYYKYTDFLIQNLNIVFKQDWPLLHLLLPLGVSFFTFQQISFLIDTYQGKDTEADFVNYALFVTFFPQLIAGPIVHHSEILPQFKEKKLFRVNGDDFAAGMTMFTIGLGKKVWIADTVAQYSNPVFQVAAQGEMLSFLPAWIGITAYTFQIYYDFSGYSDMALGLGRMFSIRIPLNFNAPYKAVSIIDFWRRWHITLSRFLRDYVYIPLGGNRHGESRRHINLLATMLIGGLWHGAMWTFVIWGGLHGLYLIINHFWSKHIHVPETWISRWAGRLITLFAVMIAWVLFRAESYSAAVMIYKGMFGLNGVELPSAWAKIIPDFSWIHFIDVEQWSHYRGSSSMIMLAVLFLITWLMPSSHQIMQRAGFDPDPAGSSRGIRWRPSWPWAVFSGLVFIAVLSRISGASEFLYFNF